jgi:hypothetical protein
MPLVNEPAPTTAEETLEQRFRRLQSIWLKETAYQSSTTKIKNHPAFREVVSLGDAIVPLLLRELAAKPSLWVWALPEITGQDPVADAERGNLDKATAAWLQWGKDKGLTW